MGITSCFRSPTSVCRETAQVQDQKPCVRPYKEPEGTYMTRIAMIWIIFNTCSADFLTFVFESSTRRSRRARFSFAVFKIHYNVNLHQTDLNCYQNTVGIECEWMWPPAVISPALPSEPEASVLLISTVLKGRVRYVFWVCWELELPKKGPTFDQLSDFKIVSFTAAVIMQTIKKTSREKHCRSVL